MSCDYLTPSWFDEAKKIAKENSSNWEVLLQKDKYPPKLKSILMNQGSKQISIEFYRHYPVVTYNQEITQVENKEDLKNALINCFKTPAKVIKPLIFRKEQIIDNVLKSSNLKLSVDNYAPRPQLSEEDQLKAVKKEAWYLRFIINPSKAVQIAALKEDGSAIRFIENPSEELQLYAVKSIGGAVQHIENPTEKVQLIAVKNKGLNIKYIKNPSEKVQLAAVKNWGLSIEFIKNPSEDVQFNAVNQNHKAIKFIKNPSKRVQLQELKPGDKLIY